MLKKTPLVLSLTLSCIATFFIAAAPDDQDLLKTNPTEDIRKKNITSMASYDTDYDQRLREDLREDRRRADLNRERIIDDRKRADLNREILNRENLNRDIQRQEDLYQRRQDDIRQQQQQEEQQRNTSPHTGGAGPAQPTIAPIQP